MQKDLSELTQSLIAAAQKAGADHADAIAVQGESSRIEVRNSALEHAERAEGVDLGLRVLIGQRSANVSASDTRPETIAAMAERAVAMAQEAPEDPFIGLADPDQLAKDWDIDTLELYDPSAPPSPEDMKDTALRCEAAAAANSGVTQVDSAWAGYSRQSVHLAASNGFSGGYARSSIHHGCTAIASTGLDMERDYDGDGRVFAADLRSPEEVGTQAAARAVERVAPKRPKTGAYPVLFDERIASSLIGHVMGAANGAAIARGASWLRGALGDAILPDGMTLTENPHRARMPASRPFDAEGLPTSKRDVIKDGVLQNYTLDLANARKLGMDPTGNAARGTSAGPSPAVWNLELSQGTQSRDDLIAEMGTGLIVTSMIGSTINPNTGDYSRGAAGFWVENGEILYPVSGVTIAGNLRDFMRRILPANDARTYLSRVVPSLLVEGLTLAGE